MNKTKALNAIYDFASVLLTAILVVSIIFTFIFKISTVSGESMENTLHNGDNLLITAVNNEIKQGDVVVISQPNIYNLVLIKRVIATGGQTVTFDKKSGAVIVDGVPLEEDYTKEKTTRFYGMDRIYTVPEGKLFVMGDNRNNSSDSRDSNIGLIDERYVLGTVFYRIGDTKLFNREAEE